MAEYAIHDTTLIGTSNIIRKKEGSSALIDPADYPKRINLMGLLKVGGVLESDYCKIDDGADDVPMLHAIVYLPASLDGYTGTSAVQTGKNLLDNQLSDGSAGGIAYSLNSDGSISCVGTVSNTNSTRVIATNVKLPVGNYVLSGADSSISLRCTIFDKDGTYTDRNDTGNGVTVSVTATTDYLEFRARARNADEEVNTTIYPQFEVGSTPTSYEKCVSTTHTASFGRTIHGGRADLATGEGREAYGKKVFDGTEGTGGTPSWTMISVTQGTMFRITVSDKATTSATNTLCSYYTPVAQAQRADGTVSGAGTNVDIIDNRFSSVDEFKAWLSENPVTLVYETATSTDFTFDAQEINTMLGDNVFYSEDGTMGIEYRSSGTMTPILPTLISKTITANGTYSASDDGADGYDAVVVNVASQEPTVTPLNSPNAFLTSSGVTGTDVERTVRTETAPSDGKYVFASDSTCRTNTGSGDGFIEIRKNDVSVVKQYMEANTTTDIAIPDISVEAGDEITFIVGFDNAHSSCDFQLYTGIAFVSEASASLLMGSQAPVSTGNELGDELDELSDGLSEELESETEGSISEEVEE